MKVVYEFDRGCIVRRQAYSAGVRQTREYQHLRVKLSELETSQVVLQSQYSFRALVSWLAHGCAERLVNVHEAAQPGQVAVRSAFPVAPIAAAQSCAQVQILLAAVKKVGERDEIGIPV